MASQTSSPAGPGLASTILSNLHIPEQTFKDSVGMMLFFIVLLTMSGINQFLCTKAYEIATSQDPGEGDFQYAYRKLQNFKKDPKRSLEKRAVELLCCWFAINFVTAAIFLPKEMMFGVWSLCSGCVWTMGLGGILGAVVVWQNFQEELRMINATLQMWLTADEVPGTPKVESMPGAFGKE